MFLDRFHEATDSGERNDSVVGRWRSIVMMAGGMVLVVQGLWMQEWPLSLLGSLLGFKGVKAYATPHLLTNTTADLARRAALSRTVLSEDITSRVVIIERIASLQEDLDRIQEAFGVRSRTLRALTLTAGGLTTAVAAFLSFTRLHMGDVLAATLLAILAAWTVLLIVRSEGATRQHQKASDILEGQIADLRARLSVVQDDRSSLSMG